MQLKKTHDAAMVLLQRAYGERPRYNYFIGTSQGGREALTVAQRYPADYDGIAANVPIVSFSSLMLAPELIRIREKPLANWVTPARVNAIRGEFIRQYDKLDGLADGIMNNYMACRATFDMSQGAPNRCPWAAKRCPHNVDSNPQDTTSAACLTDDQISTLNVVYEPLQICDAVGQRIEAIRHVGPEHRSFRERSHPERPFHRPGRRCAANARMHSHLGVLGVTGFLMKNRAAAQVRTVLPPEISSVFLHSRSIAKTLAAESKPPRDTLFTIISRWPDFLHWTRTTLVAVGSVRRLSIFEMPAKKDGSAG